jgi:hypothetical protein
MNQPSKAPQDTDQYLGRAKGITGSGSPEDDIIQVAQDSQREAR